MLMVPLKATPSQSVTILLSNQYCRINVYQKSTGMFCDVFVNNVSVVTSRVIRDRLPIVLQPYFGFIGDLCFIDLQGKEDPDYAEIGSRFFLLYLT